MTDGMTRKIELNPPAVHMFPKVFHRGKHVFKSVASGLQSLRTMKPTLLLAALLVAAPAYAQSGVQPPKGWSLGIFVGGAAFTDFQREDVRSVGITASGRPFDLQYPQRLGAGTTGTLAATLAFWPTRN